MHQRQTVSVLCLTWLLSLSVPCYTQVQVATVILETKKNIQIKKSEFTPVFNKKTENGHLNHIQKFH